MTHATTRPCARSAGAHPAAGRVRAGVGVVLQALLLVGPQLELHAHLGATPLTVVLVAGRHTPG